MDRSSSLVFILLLSVGILLLPAQASANLQYKSSGEDQGKNAISNSSDTNAGIPIPPVILAGPAWCDVYRDASVSADTGVFVVAYIPNWIDLNAFSKTIDYSKLTHINIAFENPDAGGNLSFSPIDNYLIDKARAAGVKILVSIGGGSESEDPVAQAKYFNLISEVNCSQFVSKILAYLELHHFDGIDVDLEGPAINSDYGNFIETLSDSLAPAGKIITSALSQGYGGGSVPSSAFQYFDFVNIMAYDATGPWNANKPGQHSSYNLAVSQLSYWKGRGLPKEKAVLGLPFYGYGFGTAYRSYDYAYSEIVAGYPGAENKDQVGSTIYYNGIHTIKKKTILAMQEGKGVMIWELASDATGPKSLLLAIDQVIQGTDTLPAEPLDLLATAISSSRIDLKWTDNSDNETSFRIDRSADGLSGWSLLASVGLNINKYSNTLLSAGTTYFYRVRAENFTGNSEYSNISSASTLPDYTGIPGITGNSADFTIFPNPASENINIGYSLASETNVSLVLFNLQGQLVKTLIQDEHQLPGSYTRIFDTSDLSNGIYFARFTNGQGIKTMKLVIQKEF